MFFSGSSAYRPMTDKERKSAGDVPEDVPEVEGIETLLQYAPERVLLSGWIKTPQVIERHAAWARVPTGEGTIHLFGFRP